MKHSSKLTSVLYLCDIEEKNSLGSSIRHWIYCTSKGLHALGWAIVNKINLQLNKNTILIIQSWKMLINLPLFSLNHIRLIAFSVQCKDNTYQHIDSIVSLREQRSFVLRCFWEQDHGWTDSGLLWGSTL